MARWWQWWERKARGQLLLLASFTYVFAHQSASLSNACKHVYSDLFKDLEVKLFVLPFIRSWGAYPFCLWLHHSFPFLNTLVNIYRPDDTFIIPSKNMYQAPNICQELSWGLRTWSWLISRVLTFKELSASWEERRGTIPEQLEGGRAELNEDTEEGVRIHTREKIRRAFWVRMVATHLVNWEESMVKTVSYVKDDCTLACKLQPGRRPCDFYQPHWDEQGPETSIPWLYFLPGYIPPLRLDNSG